MESIPKFTNRNTSQYIKTLENIHKKDYWAAKDPSFSVALSYFSQHADKLSLHQRFQIFEHLHTFTKGEVGPKLPVTPLPATSTSKKKYSKVVAEDPLVATARILAAKLKPVSPLPIADRKFIQSHYQVLKGRDKSVDFFNQAIPQGEFLITALWAGDMATLKLHLLGRPNLETPLGKPAKSALAWAAEYNKPDMVKLLLEAGAKTTDVLATLPDLDASATKSERQRRAAVIKALLDKGGIPDNHQLRLKLLPFALEFKWKDIAEQMFRDAIQKGGRESEEYVKKQLKLDPSSANRVLGRYTPLGWAAESGQTEITRLLLDAKADPNKHAAGHVTPLMMATYHCCTKVVDLLLSKGARADETIGRSFFERHYEPGDDMLTPSHDKPLDRSATALTIALNMTTRDEKTQNDIIRKLVEAGTPIDPKRRQEVFGWAITYDWDRNTAERVVPKDQHAGFEDPFGRTLLMLAAKTGQTSWVTELTSALIGKKKGTAWVDRPSQRTGTTPLMYAAAAGHAGTVHYLLGQADASMANKEGQTAFMLAAEAGHTDTVQAFLKRKPEDFTKHLGEVDKDGDTLLHRLIKKGDIQTIRLLMKDDSVRAALNINAKDGTGQTALMLAVESDHLAICQELLRYEDAQAGLDRVNQKGQNALTLAFENDSQGIVDLIVKTHPKPLILAVQGRNSDLVTDLLLNEAVFSTINQADEQGNTPLRQAVQQGDADLVKLLRDAGASVLQPNLRGETLLMTAARAGHKPILEMLPHDARSLAARNVQAGQTALMLAAAEGHIEAIEWFLKQKEMTLQDTDAEGNTAFMLAAKKGHIGVVNLLLKQGIDLEKTNRQGDTALMLALRDGHIEIAELLLAQKKTPTIVKGEPIFLAVAKEGNRKAAQFLLERLPAKETLQARDANGRSPIMLAAQNGHYLLTTHLAQQQLGIAPSKGKGKLAPRLANLLNQRDKEGNTALMLAAQAGHLEQVRNLLIYDGVDYQSPNHDHKTALDLAKESNHPDIVALLEEHLHEPPAVAA